MLEHKWDDVMCYIASGHHLVAQIGDLFPENELVAKEAVTGDAAMHCGISNEVALKILKEMEKRDLIYFIGTDEVRLTEKAETLINCRKQH